MLIVIYDDRWSDLKKSIIGLTEVDMTNNGGIFYISPDFMINLGEFGKHIKIGIQTKGYEEMSIDVFLKTFLKTSMIEDFLKTFFTNIFPFPWA